MKRKKGILIVILIILVFSLLLFRAIPKTKTLDKNLTQYTSQVLKICASASHRQSCYDKEIPKLMDQPSSVTMEEAFKITRLVQDQDKSFPYCHVLGHNLSAKEVKKDPSKWREVLSRCPSGVCSNGCIHGGFQERFRAESFTDEEVAKIRPDLSVICESRSNWQPTGLEQASCYHALGHLNMYLTSADIKKSIRLCDEIAVKKDGRNFMQVCLDGVFMQIYQPLEPEDFDLIAGKQVTKDGLDSFCAPYTGYAKASCLSESWPLFRSELMDNSEALINFCSKLEKDAQARCFEGMFYVLTAQFNFDLDRIKNYCSSLPQDLEGKCFASSATRLIETDYRYTTDASKLCSAAESLAKEECFSELLKFSTYNFHAGSPQFIKLCNDLPDPWKAKCYAKKI